MKAKPKFYYAFAALAILAFTLTAMIAATHEKWFTSAGPFRPATVGGGGGSGAPNHVLTMDFFQGFSGTKNVTPFAAAPYLSWGYNVNDAASGGYAGVVAVRAAGIKATLYIDTQIEYDCAGCSPLWTQLSVTTPQYESRNCSNVVNSTNPGHNAFVDLTQSGWYPYWDNVVNNEYASYTFDAVSSDDASPVGPGDGGAGYLPCGYSDTQYTPYIAALWASQSHPIIANIFASDALEATNNRTLVAASDVLGGMDEDCYAGANDYGHAGDYALTQNDNFFGAATDPWTANQNEELYQAAHGKLFVCFNNAGGAASASASLRIYVYANFLLSYNVNTSILLEEFAPTGDTIGVFPETGLVPTNPRVAAPATIAGLLNGSVYVREYNDCYYQGVDKGSCAAVVNSTAGTQNWPTLAGIYAHTVSLSGGGVLEGGSVSFTGSAPPGTLASGTAAIAVP